MMSVNKLDSLNNIIDEHTIVRNETNFSDESIPPVSDIEITKICQALYL